MTKSGLQVIALNTILWYTRDKQIGNKTDPSGQFEWLTTQLKQARDQGRKVSVVDSGQTLLSSRFSHTVDILQYQIICCNL